MSKYKLVPVEPTDEMVKTVMLEVKRHYDLGLNLLGYVPCTELCKAMLSASPKIEIGQGLIIQSIQADTVIIDRAEYEAMKADAERYRWLRAENANLEDDTFVVLGHDTTAEEQWQKYWVGSYLDQAIDQARKI